MHIFLFSKKGSMYFTMGSCKGGGEKKVKKKKVRITRKAIWYSNLRVPPWSPVYFVTHGTIF